MFFMRRANGLLASSLLLVSAASQASFGGESFPTSQDEMGFWQGWGHALAETYKSSTVDLYVPVHTRHNRATYDPDKVARYNERPTGMGYGLSRVDANGNWHGLYAMAFMDSNNHLQPIIGYNFEWMWRPESVPGLRVGLGYTVNITGRAEYHYVPLPLLLPLASVEYKRLSVQATYIPGTYNNGNVLFTSIRWRL